MNLLTKLVAASVLAIGSFTAQAQVYDFDIVNSTLCSYSVTFYHVTDRSACVTAAGTAVGMTLSSLSSVGYTAPAGQQINRVTVYCGAVQIAEWTCSSGWTNYAEFNDMLPCTGTGDIVGVFASQDFGDPTSHHIQYNTAD